VTRVHEGPRGARSAAEFTSAPSELVQFYDTSGNNYASYTTFRAGRVRPKTMAEIEIFGADQLNRRMDDHEDPTPDGLSRDLYRGGLGRRIDFAGQRPRLPLVPASLQSQPQQRPYTNLPRLRLRRRP
jgi:hypothetical protein